MGDTQKQEDQLGDRWGNTGIRVQQWRENGTHSGSILKVELDLLTAWLQGVRQGWLRGLPAWATRRMDFTSTFLGTASKAGWGRSVQLATWGLRYLLIIKRESNGRKAGGSPSVDFGREILATEWFGSTSHVIVNRCSSASSVSGKGS